MNDDELRNAFDSRIARHSPAGADEVLRATQDEPSGPEPGDGPTTASGLARPRMLLAAAALVMVAGIAGLVALANNNSSDPVDVVGNPGTDTSVMGPIDTGGTTDTTGSPTTPPTSEAPPAFSNPFAECGDLYQSGDAPAPPVADEATLGELRELIQSQVMADSANQVISISHQNVYGRVSVGLAARNQNTIGLIDKIASPPTFEDDYVCVELPPADFDDTTPVRAVWEIADASLPVEENWETLTLLVDDPDPGCGHNPSGRVQEPTVDYRQDEIEITVLLDALPYGAYTCEGWAPLEVQVSLTEAPGGRPLVGSAEPIDYSAEQEPETLDEPMPTPATVPEPGAPASACADLGASPSRSIDGVADC